MSTATTASQGARDAAAEAREGLREVRGAAGATSDNVQNDLQKLREEFSRLAAQVGEIASNRGSAAWRRARSGVDDVVADAQDRGRDAVGAMREVSNNFVEAIDDSIAKRPYTTLALVAAVAFVFGATWRR